MQIDIAQFETKRTGIKLDLKMGDSESTGFSSNFGGNVSFDREMCGNLTEDYKKVLIWYIIIQISKVLFLCAHDDRKG